MYLMVLDTHVGSGRGSTAELIIAYSRLTQLSPMQCGKGGTGLVGGSLRTLCELSSAREVKTPMKRLRMKGVMIKKIKFLGFLKVRIRFL